MAEEYKRSTNELIERLSTCETLAPSRDSAVLQKCLASLAVRSSPSYTPSALDSRLLAAMDAAQRGSERLSGHLPLQPNALKKWDFRSEPLTGIFRRVSIQEAAANERASGKTSEIGRLFAQLDTIGTTSPRKAPNAEDVFTELRQSFMHFGMAIDQNDVVRKRVIMQDKEQQKAHIMLRLLEVRKLPCGDPVVFLLYHHYNRKQLEEKGPPSGPLRWLQNGGLNSNTATVEEQVLFIRLLEMNATRLDQKWKPKREADEGAFRLSFFLPCMPLDQAALAKFDKEDACKVCGSPGKKRCSRCKGEDQYCSAECQKQDYPSHKALCRAIASSAFFEFPLHNTPNDMPYVSTINRNASGNDIGKTAIITKDSVQPNVHADNLFIAKVQLSIDPSRGMAVDSIMIYDSRRTFTMHLNKRDSPADFSRLVDRTRKDGPRGIKLYVWAQRLGEDRIKILYEQLPNQNVAW